MATYNELTGTLSGSSSLEGILGTSFGYSDDEIDTMISNIADTYSSSSTYAVGDYVLYDSVLYICTTAVETAGDFDSDYWTQVTVGEEIADVKNDIDALQLESGMMDIAVLENQNILITGDSISFNNYGFGTDYQSTMDDCYPGIMSWSNMLRMTLLEQHFNYVPARELAFYSNVSVKNGSGTSDTYHYDFGGDYLYINTAQLSVGVANNPTFTFQPSVRGTGWYLVYANTATEAEECDFTVYIDDTSVGTYENYSDTTHQGIATRFALIDGEITGASVVKIVLSGTSSGGSLRLYGLINVHPDFVWTGVGGRETAEMVEDYQNIIGQYAEDTTLMILAAGTNDLNYDDTIDASESAANISTLITNAQTDGITDILVLGPSYLTSIDTERIQAFDLAYRNVCNDLNVPYLSTYDILRHRTSGWQTSGPHFLRGANNAVYAAFCKHFDIHPIYNARLYRLASKSYLTSDIEYQIQCVNGVVSVIDATTGNAVTDLDYTVVFSGTDPSNRLTTITIGCAGIPSVDLLSLSSGISVFVGSYSTAANRKLTLVLGATDSSGTRVDMTGISFYVNVHSHSTYAEHTEHFYAIP